MSVRALLVVALLAGCQGILGLEEGSVAKGDGGGGGTSSTEAVGGSGQGAAGGGGGASGCTDCVVPPLASGPFFVTQSPDSVTCEDASMSELLGGTDPTGDGPAECTPCVCQASGCAMQPLVTYLEEDCASPHTSYLGSAHGSCVAIPGADATTIASADVTITGNLACPPSGGTPMFNEIAFTTTFQGCRAETDGCAGGTCPAPPPDFIGPCVVFDQAVTCQAPYTNQFDISAANDTRACSACSCPTSCSDGSLTLYGAADCMGSASGTFTDPTVCMHPTVPVAVRAVQLEYNCDGGEASGDSGLHTRTLCCMP